MSPCGNIVLIGLSGAGKTSCAEVLASLMNLSMLDTDQIIQSRAKKSVAEIFKDEGEAHFRTLERAVIEELLERQEPLKNTVLSVGGGLPTYLDNIELLKRIGFTVFLNTSPKTLARRLAEDAVSDKGLRPLLGTGDPRQSSGCKDSSSERDSEKDREKHIENLEKRLSEQLAGRFKHYEKAHMVVSTDGKTKQDVCFEIQTILINNTIL
jgi:shikimate kinase